MYIQNGGLECSLGRDLVQGAGRLPAGADLRDLHAGAGRDATSSTPTTAWARTGRAARGCARTPADGHRGGHHRPRRADDLRRRAGGARTTRSIPRTRATDFTHGQPGGLRSADLQRVPGLGHRRPGAEPELGGDTPRSRSTSWTAAATSSRRWSTGSARAAARRSSCRWSRTCRATGSASIRVESQEWWTPGDPAGAVRRTSWAWRR